MKSRLSSWIFGGFMLIMGGRIGALIIERVASLSRKSPLKKAVVLLR